jgi:hypothetical protein
MNCCLKCLKTEEKIKIIGHFERIGPLNGHLGKDHSDSYRRKIELNEAVQTNYYMSTRWYLCSNCDYV